MAADLRIAETLTRLDHEQMALYKRNYFRHELVTPPAVTYGWYIHNRETCVAVRDTHRGDIVAHLNILPITAKLYAEFQAGNCDDTQIPLEYIRKYDSPGYYLLYLCSVAADPRYPGLSLLRLMVKEYIKIFHRLARRKILASEVIADAVTPQGEKLCNLFGLKPGHSSSHNSTIYSASAAEFIDNVSRLTKNERLAEIRAQIQPIFAT